MIKYVFALVLSFASMATFCQADTLRADSINTVQSTTIKNEPVYKLKPSIDVPVTIISAGWSAYAFTKIYSKDPSSEETILALKQGNINGFDRWAADVYSEKAANNSDFFFYGAMPLPLILLADKHIRKDAAKVGFLYLEAMSVTGLLYTGSTYLTDRYRPLAYNPEVSIDERKKGGTKNSFFAGHVALVATSSFFTAKVFSDYHPQSKLRWVFYSAAIVATSGTAYLRHRGGKHFPSDILIGTAIGTLSGLLVPHFHKNKTGNSKLSIRPYTGNSHGVYVAYKL